ncbi:unnamed protein product [Diamesa serratosioi]
MLIIKILIACGLLVSCQGYQIGVGRSDCTGPSCEINFMGYAKIQQKGHGIHLRQFARAFIMDDGSKRVVFVSVDAGMISHAVKLNVIKELAIKYGNLYNFNNLLISGTHTHSAPGGFNMYLLYDLTSLGFVAETFNALVRGITKSIDNAHNNMKAGRIFISETEIQDANINRSPIAYENNPPMEKAEYKSNTDKKLVQVRFMDMNNKQPIGAINWFAVHPTSMNSTNKYISSDNVGFASILLEQQINNDLPGKGAFVGTFASTNLGDVSPNIKGPKCQMTGLSCDILSSTCPNKDLCIASGPGTNMFDSTKIIANRMYKGASQLLNEKGGREVTGSIKFVHQFVEMSKENANYYNPETSRNESVRGCIPALGYSFAAGTTDGPGAFDFKQGTLSDNELWNIVRDFVAEPTKDDIYCHKEKPILLATGRAVYPYDWQPHIVPTQIFLIGDLVLLAVPGEFSTMSGRRMRSEIQRAAKEAGKDLQVVIAGLANSYSSYVTTPEEYEIQRYEGASTIYGKHTLTIYINQYKKLIQSILNNKPIGPGPFPPRLDDKQISLNTGVIYDGHGIGWDFGYVEYQPLDNYKKGDVVYTRFVAGNPRNNLMSDSTYFTVEQKQPDGNWKVIANDANWETRFKWTRISSILGQSVIEFYWGPIPVNTAAGSYRIRHFGSYRYILGGIYPYQGGTKTFIVT